MTTSTPSLQPVFDRINQYIAAGEMDGAALAVAHRGVQVCEWVGGNAAPNHVASANTLWPLASISKTYAATMVMTLVQSGELGLAHRVTTNLPGFHGGDKDLITLRHLLTHTSGIMYESPFNSDRIATGWTVAQIVEESFTFPLMFYPGAGFSYSDWNYGLAGQIAAAMLGSTFPQLVHERVLAPAGLTNTFMGTPDAEHARMAQVSDCWGFGTPGDMYNSPNGRRLGYPSTGCAATINDLLKFGMLFRAESDNHVLSRATRRAMATDQIGGGAIGSSPPDWDTRHRRAVAWGLGFWIQGANNPGAFGDLMPIGTFGHGGASGCALTINPVDDIVIAFVSNRHANSGRERWSQRITGVQNGVMAALT